MSNNRAAREKFQSKGQAVVNAARRDEVKPMTSLLDFADGKTKRALTEQRLEKLREELAQVMSLPGVGLVSNENCRTKNKIVAQIAECRKLLETTEK